MRKISSRKKLFRNISSEKFRQLHCKDFVGQKFRRWKISSFCDNSALYAYLTMFLQNFAQRTFMIKALWAILVSIFVNMEKFVLPNISSLKNYVGKKSNAEKFRPRFWCSWNFSALNFLHLRYMFFLHATQRWRNSSRAWLHALTGDRCRGSWPNLH